MAALGIQRVLLIQLAIGGGMATAKALYLILHYGHGSEASRHADWGFSIAWCSGAAIGWVLARVLQRTNST
jgi:hypothetical protein